MAEVSSILSVESSSYKLSHGDTIRSDHSNSRQGHASLWYIERGKGKMEVSSRGALQLITLPSTDRRMKRFRKGRITTQGKRDTYANTCICVNM